MLNPPFPVRLLQNFQTARPLPPAAKVKPPAPVRFALGPTGAQTQCSPLVGSNMNIWINFLNVSLFVNNVYLIVFAHHLYFYI